MNIDNAIAAILDEMNGNGDEMFTFVQAQQWAKEYGFNVERPAPIIQGLTARGKRMTERKPPRQVAGYTRNPHDRWQACPSHGGGGSSIVGLAGYAG